LTGLYQERARVGANDGSNGVEHDIGDKYALLGREDRCTTYTGRRISIWSHVGAAPQRGAAKASNPGGIGGSGNSQSSWHNRPFLGKVACDTERGIEGVAARGTIARYGGDAATRHQAVA